MPTVSPRVASWGLITETELTVETTAPMLGGVGANIKGKEQMPMKTKHSLADQIFGIGKYTYSDDGQLYFIHGKTRIKVKEHFSGTGKTIDTLISDLILFSSKQENTHGSSTQS